MDELPWFDGRADSLEQILNLRESYRSDSLLVALEFALDAKSAPLSPPERVVLAVEALEREVENGGYEQFFFNSSNEYVSIIVESLTAIGCPTIAGITARAIETLNLRPGYTASDVQDAATELGEGDRALLTSLGRRYYEYPEPIDERLFAYIVDHRDEIAIP